MAQAIVQDGAAEEAEEQAAIARAVAAQEAKDAEAEEDAKNEDVISDELSVAWTEPDADGLIEGTLFGSFSFRIHEGEAEQERDGAKVKVPAWKSGMFRSTQYDLMGALALGFTNAARRTFKAKWYELHPEDMPERKVREKAAEKIAKAEAIAATAVAEKDAILSRAEVAEKQAAELMAAIKEKRAPDFKAAGVEAPEGF